MKFQILENEVGEQDVGNSGRTMDRNSSPSAIAGNIHLTEESPRLPIRGRRATHHKVRSGCLRCRFAALKSASLNFRS